jgi:hypothetical protein
VGADRAAGMLPELRQVTESFHRVNVENLPQRK